MAGLWLQAGQNVADPHAQFGFPDSDDVQVFMVKGGNVTKMIIWYVAVPGILFNNAPAGAILIDQVLGVVHVMKTDGTWT
jgi:hypothetical protein